jgi:hypothetical protein
MLGGLPAQGAAHIMHSRTGQLSTAIVTID